MSHDEFVKRQKAKEDAWDEFCAAIENFKDAQKTLTEATNSNITARKMLDDMALDYINKSIAYDGPMRVMQKLMGANYGF